MAQQRSQKRRKQALSLTIRVSGLLVLAAVLPLVLTVVIIDVLSRPTLITQTSQEMQTDAQTHTQLIDNYFAQQLLEADAVSRLQPIQKFLGGDKSDVTRAQAQNSLATGRGRGSFYEDWSLLDLHGNLQLYYPTQPALHGMYYISPTYLQRFQPSDVQQIQARSALFSNVFYNQVSNEAYIDIYAPVFSANYELVGILRATFDLHYIWDIVNKEAGANGPNSYAMIIDQYGVCIAQTNPDADPFSQTNAPNLFRSITPLSATTQQLIQENELYDNSSIPLLDNNTQLAPLLHHTSSFQLVPPGKQIAYQAATSVATSVNWTYLVLNPLNNITSVADNLIYLTSFITLGILILAALIGLGLGRRITRPILQSVAHLHQSSESLKALASKEQGAATQQTWVVDSSQVGLRTVQYYTNAASIALQRLNETGNSLVSHWHHVEPENAKKAVEQLIEHGRYIEKAIHYQTSSNKKLESTIQVTIQVADQLATGATSATEAAEQLEQVVNELQHVIGR